MPVKKICCCQSGGSSSYPTAQNIAEAIVNENRNRVTTVIESFGGTNVQSLSVPAGTMGVLRYVGDHGGGVVRMDINGADPVNDSYVEINARSTLNLHGVDLSLVRFNGTATNSDYSVAYEIWS